VLKKKSINIFYYFETFSVERFVVLLVDFFFACVFSVLFTSLTLPPLALCPLLLLPLFSPPELFTLLCFELAADFFVDLFSPSEFSPLALWRDVGDLLLGAFLTEPLVVGLRSSVSEVSSVSAGGLRLVFGLLETFVDCFDLSLLVVFMADDFFVVDGGLFSGLSESSESRVRVRFAPVFVPEVVFFAVDFLSCSSSVLVLADLADFGVILFFFFGVCSSLSSLSSSFFAGIFYFFGFSSWLAHFSTWGRSFFCLRFRSGTVRFG